MSAHLTRSGMLRKTMLGVPELGDYRDARLSKLRRLACGLAAALFVFSLAATSYGAVANKTLPTPPKKARTASPPPLPASVERPPCTVTGTQGNDFLRVTRDREVICGLSGNDRIVALGGEQLIFAGPGNDLIKARNGKPDLILSGSGRDRLRLDKAIDRTKMPFVFRASRTGPSKAGTTSKPQIGGETLSNQSLSPKTASAAASASAGSFFLGPVYCQSPVVAPLAGAAYGLNTTGGHDWSYVYWRPWVYDFSGSQYFSGWRQGSWYYSWAWEDTYTNYWWDLNGNYQGTQAWGDNPAYQLFPFYQVNFEHYGYSEFWWNDHATNTWVNNGGYASQYIGPDNHAAGVYGPTCEW